MDRERCALPRAVWFCGDSCDCGSWSLLLSEEGFMKPNNSLQATRDGVSSSAIADYVISPACLSSGR